jgi:hypothetical protein
MELHWVKEHDEQYSADGGNRTYIIRLFNVGGYDGDPTLIMDDDRYRSTCWSLTTRVGIVTRNRVRLFNDLSSALFAAQVAEDNARDHKRQHSDVGDRPGRHRRRVNETTSPRSPAATARPTRTGPAYIADGDRQGDGPVAGR